MKKLIVLLLLLLMTFTVAYAEDAEITVSIPDTFLHVQYQGEAYFAFTIKNNLTTSAEFDISYSLSTDNVKKEYGKVTVGGLQTEIFKISEGLPNGAYTVTVEAKSGESTYSSSILMSVMNKYEKQFMQEYTKLGVCLAIEYADPASRSVYAERVSTNAKLLSLAEQLGFAYFRYYNATHWHLLENDDGKIRDTIPKEYMNNLADTNSILFMEITRPSNGVGGNSGWSSRTPEQIENNIEFIRKKMKLFPTQAYLAEFGNEPDLESMWPGRDLYGIQYTDLMRHFYLMIDEEAPDFTFAGAVVSSGGEGVPFLDYMFQQDAYKYMDALCYHPYIKYATVDDRYDTFSKPFEIMPDGYGGWLQRVITELGWESLWEENDTFMTHYEKAENVTKMFLKNYLHDIDLTMYYSLKAYDHFGLQKDFENMTPCSIASSQCTRMLNSAQYVGEWHLNENSECAMFIRDGKPFMAGWIPGDDEYKLTFDTEITVEDMYGNVIAENTKEVIINSEVKYIYGFGMNYVYDVVNDVKNRVIDQICTQYEGKFDATVFDNIKKLDAKSFSDDFATAIDMFYDSGDALIDMFAQDKTTLELKELTESLHILNMAGEKLANAYGMTMGDMKYPISEKYKSVQAKVDKLKSIEKYSQILYTDKMLKYSRRYYNKAKDAQSREYNIMRQPIVTVNSFLSERVAIWAEKILPFQEVDVNIGILTHAWPEQTHFFTSTESAETQYEIYNKRSLPIDGEIVVVNGNGEQQGEAIPVKVDAWGYAKLPVVVYNDKSDIEKDIYKIKLVQNGEVINERWFPVTRQATIKAELAPADNIFSALETITVKIINNTPVAIRGKVNITSVPEGWSLESANEEYSLEASETKYVTFKVDAKKKVAFNNYIFGVNITDDAGKTLYDRKNLLSFPFVVQADKSIDIKNFNGDISDWANAYPLYTTSIYPRETPVPLPENPEIKDEWRKEDVSAITYLKYDNDNIYIMSTVYDQTFHLLDTGVNSWMSDSVQWYIDPINNGGEVPQSDDYSFYGAYTPLGNEMGVNSVSDGIFSTMDENIKVLRDNDLNITRYIIKMPFSSVVPLTSKTSAFRFNMCFNDSDEGSRHKVIEISEGLLDGNNARKPGRYYEYRFVGMETAADTPFEDALVDVTMNSIFAGMEN